MSTPALLQVNIDRNGLTGTFYQKRDSDGDPGTVVGEYVAQLRDTLETTGLDALLLQMITSENTFVSQWDAGGVTADYTYELHVTDDGIAVALQGDHALADYGLGDEEGVAR